jgi:hypothetical protein
MDNNSIVSSNPLSSRELAVETAIAIDRIQDILSKSNPRIAQILISYAMSDIPDRESVLQSTPSNWQPYRAE